MAKMTWLERRYRRSRLDYVRHITIDPRGPGVVRIHMIPPRTEDPADPFLLLLNGAQLVPLNLSWAILLANFMDQLEPWSGREIGEQDWQSMLSAAVKATRRTYPGTGKAVLLGDLELMLRSIVAIARGQEPPAEVGALSLGEYAGRMSAPHRMDLMISAMTREGRWHCNQKCLHCYAAGQTLGETPELTTDQWRELLEKLRRANIPQVTPNTEDGSLRIQVTLEWTVLAEGPVSWVKIGVPNGSIRQEQALTDNIDRLSFDNSYMYVYFNRDYDDGETFRFSYSWIQEYMYTLGADGSVEYVYTPGWFSEARVGQMTLTWHDPAGVDGVDSLGNTGGDHAAVLTDLDHGQQLDFTVRYDSWPAQLAQEGSRDNLPQDNDPEYDPGYDPDYQDGGLGLVGLVILLVVVFLIVRVAAASDGYRGGFGTHYVFVSGLWYPAGPDGRPRPGSHGTREKPKPPRSGGFGGGSRGGGFGGGGFGGGGHCACASSCACACACACAGGGRAGCSAKNLYGAVHLDQELTREMEK